ncbi:Ig-like domain-containing protein [Chitinophaga filiformis]|uniref:Ig-like domain-containing protein n=1 Tax=Chitinophaga filiformis TaxID=104663 RepID=UPI001F20959E|nr:Ig-like domain-containing protein [Chitinophaga filiformis]MCF6406970.1 Ig-like domain-containing protein [Chitinophaga filiformis]
MNDTFTRGISRILLILFFMVAGFEGFAQYTKSSLETGGYYSAMAKDNSGNLYVVRYNSSTTNYEVAKYTNGTGTPQVIYSNLIDASANEIYSWGLAVNDLGDVFVTNPDQGTAWSIIKLAAPTYTASVIHTGNYYSALAVDNSNNLLAMEYNAGSQTYQLMRYPFGAEQLAGSPVWDGFTYPNDGAGNLITPATYPTNIVVDSHDNIYLTDFHENSGGRIVKLTAPGFGASQLASGRGFSSLAIDATDNFYTSEANPGDANKYEIVKYTDLTQTGQVLYSDLHQTTGTFFPWGLAIMPNGNIFANDGENGGEVVKLSPPNINVSGVVRASANPTNATSVTYTVTFSGSAAGVTTNAFTLVPTGVSGASITGVTGSGTTYTVTVNTGTGSGTIGLNVNGTGISPTVANAPYTGQVYIIDRVAPTGSILINGGASVTNNPNVTLTLTGSDANPPLQMAFSIDGGAYTTYEAFATTKALTLPSTEGTRTVDVRLRDAAGNIAGYSDDITLDLTAPNTTLTGTPPSSTNSTTATFTFTSNDASATFEASLDGGAYTAVVSPRTFTGLAEGAHTFSVRAVDPAGNVDATPAIYNWTIDATGPQITSVGVPANGYYRAGQNLDFKVRYNEPAIVDQTAGTPYINLIIGLDAVQVPYIGGTGTSELTFRYTVQQGEMDMDGISVQPLVQNNSGSIKDALGNDASTSLQNVANTTLVRVNTSIPSVTLSTVTPMPTNGAFTVTATFSEAVSGLTVSDFNVLNTTVSNLQTSDNITYTVLMTPSSDGTRNISLPSGAAVNIGGNPNTPSNTLTYTYDATAPTVTSVAVPANKYYRAGETLNFTVNFSENIILNTAGGTPSLRLTIGAIPVEATYTGTSGSNALTFSYTVVNGDMDMDGITVNALTLNGATLRDAATNNANLTLNNVAPTTGVFVNTAHPSVTISSAAPAIVNAPYTATITFSEAAFNFVASDITTSNASLSNLSTSDNITYTVLVTPTTDGTVTLNIAADVAENIAANGNSASNTLSRIYDVAPPSVTAVDVPVNGYYKAATIMDFTVHFSENITLNTSGGTPTLSLIIGSSTVNATYNGTSGTDGLNFSYTVVNGDMDMNGIQVSALLLNGSTIRDVANNNAILTLNNVANTAGVFVNTQHPSVTLSTTAPALVNVPYTVTVTFSEEVTGLTAGDFNVTNATVGTPATTNDITYTVLVTPTADGPVSISLPAGAAVNIGDNDNTASNTINNTYDGTVPTVTAVAVPANGYYKAGTTLDFIVRFSENITLNTSGGNPGLALTIGTATVNAAYTGLNGTDGLNFSYTVQSGDMDMDGIVINNLVLNGATIKDDATNNANLTLNNVGNTTLVRVNTSIPTVTLSTTAADPTNAPFTVTVTFSEAVTGLDLADFNVSNATLSSLNTADNITYTLLFFPASNGLTSISLPADATLNIGDNGNTASNTLTRVYDATAPTVTSVAVPANRYYVSGETLSFTVNFSEDIILNTTGGTPTLGLTIGTTAVQAAYAGTAGTDALVFTYTVANGDLDTDGITVNTLTLNGATIRDAATNNANLTLNNIAPTSGVLVDGTTPVVTAVTVPVNDYYNAGAPLNFTVRFNEPVIINTTGGTPTLALNIGGTVVNAAYTGTNGTDGLNFSYVVLDGQMDMDGIQVVSLNAAGSTIRDAATNDADLTLNNVGNTSGVFVNTAHPSVTISTTATASVNTPFTVDIAFSENVTGFTSADVAVTNGNASPVTVIDNAHYSIIVVPTTEGVVTVNIPANVAENIGHNGNIASNTLSITYDITKPTVTSVTVPADKYYNAGQVLNFTVNFDEDVNLNMPPAADPYLTLTIGAATVNATYAGASSARELNFSYTVVNGDQDMDGITVGTLVLNGSSIQDAADNDADLTLNNIGNTTQVRVNTTNPSVTLSSTANALVNAPFTVTATFSEAVTVLTASDFLVTNGALSGLSSPDNITYTITVTPTADGPVTIQVPANAVVNIGGNANTPSNTLNFTYDGTKPNVTAVVVPVSAYYKAGDVLNFTLSFSENISLNTAGGAPYLNVVLGSGTVRADYTVATANSLSFSYTVQPGDMDLDGIALGTLNLNGSTIKDDATNDAILTLNNVGSTTNVFVHTGSPSVQLSTTAAARVNAPFTVTAVFNEAVTGLAAGDFTVTNGTASALQTTDNITYTLTVTPAAEGAVTIQLPAAQAQNVVSNGNTASNTLTLTYDATAPAIDGGLSFNILERSAVGTQVGQVTATDASGIFQNWTIASDDSNGAFSIDANGNIQVADQAKLNSKVNTTVTLTVTVSDGLNTSVAAPVTIQVLMVNQSPTLDAIDNVTICPDGQEHTIQLSGASAVEPGQTYGFTIITDKAANFDKLSVSAAGLITYQLKSSATGTSAVTVTIRDNGGIANGGTDTLRRSFSIEVATLGAITISSDKGNTISKGDIVHLTATGGTTYQWDNADGIISGQQSAVLEVRPMQNTTYHVTASNDAGCTNTADFTVTVVADFKVDAVNLLTPNGDGKNDKWVIRNLDSYPNNEVKIFDRAGRLVYTRRNYSNDWDGTMNGSPLAEGTYYYILTIEGGAKTAKGYITIVRDRN